MATETIVMDMILFVVMVMVVVMVTMTVIGNNDGDSDHAPGQRPPAVSKPWGHGSS